MSGDYMPAALNPESRPFFPSAPIIESYNTAIFLGVAIPVSLKRFFST
jgi:hypothetical protein